jgi:hypothetical protein
MFVAKLQITTAVVLSVGVLGTDLLSQGVHAEKAPAQQPVAAISPDQFDPLVKLILPAEERGETKWLEIPWLTDTLAARKKAAAEDKPIVVWTMSACPLGGD